MTSSPRGRGFPNDDRGEAGRGCILIANDDVVIEIQKVCHINIFLDFKGILPKFFPKFSNSGKNSRVNFNLNQFVSGF